MAELDWVKGLFDLMYNLYEIVASSISVRKREKNKASKYNSTDNYSILYITSNLLCLVTWRLLEPEVVLLSIIALRGFFFQ